MAEEFDFSEFLNVFLQEATEQLEKLDDGLLRFEREPANTDILNEIFRAAHTLKGSSAAMGFVHIRDLTHDAENLLDALRSADEEARTYSVDALLATTAVLRAFLDQLIAGDSTGESLNDAVAQAREKLSQSMPGAARSEPPQTGSPVQPADPGMPIPYYQVTFSSDCTMPAVRAFMAVQAIEGFGNVNWQKPEGDALDNLKPGEPFFIGAELTDGVDPEFLVTKVKNIGEIEDCKYIATAQPADVPVSNQEPSSAALPQARKSASGSESSSAESVQTVRVAVDRLDRLVNLIGELVVDRTGLAMIENTLSEKFDTDESVQSLGGIANHLERVVSDLHDEIMKMRMLPVGQVFRRFPRMVRDTAHKLNKKVNLVLEGEETGLDRSILEDIVDPLTHILRNSIDHGIETPAERLAAGKPEEGTVLLSARHEEGNVLIEIEDDGKGIDTALLREAAVKKGALSADAASKLDDRESLMLLFQSGVSTAKQVTDISGRGVGMDVVKNNIDKLHGQVEVRSVLGKGSIFSVRLPLTLAIVQALIIRCGERLFALPLASVVSATIKEAETVHTIQGIPCVVVRGETIPLLSVESLFETGAACSKDNNLVVIVQSRGQQAAFKVDDLIGKMDVVVKSLGSYLGEIQGFSGAAILGDGNLALILDVGSIMDMARKNTEMAAA